jgi:hypothetical protein
MRDLHTYPINNADRLAALKRLRAEYLAKLDSLAPENLPIGDMMGVVLDDLIELFASGKVPE